MRIVPSIVVHERRPVGHACYLIPVIPPRHDASIFVCVLPEPVVGLTEIIKDVSPAKNKEKNLISKLNFYIPIIAITNKLCQLLYAANPMLIRVRQ